MPGVGEDVIIEYIFEVCVIDIIARNRQLTRHMEVK